MATIQINRTKTGVVPVALADGELYIDQLNNKLYWADSTGAIKSLTLLLPTFAPSATTDTTNASNITTGQLPPAQGGCPPGAIMAFGMAAAPTGWLECNGAAVNRTTYAALYTAIGTTWGAGDGVTTFNVPDLRAQFLRGWDHGKGTDTGRTFGSYQADMYAAHKHTLTDPGHTHGLPKVGSSGTSGVLYEGFSVADYTSRLSASATTGITMANSGGAETAPKNYAILYAIKT